MIGEIGFGGSCHWCTEAIFNSLIGVEKVEQGWVEPYFITADEIDSLEVDKSIKTSRVAQNQVDQRKNKPQNEFSEAVIVHYDEEKISLQVLVAVHLHSHSCTSNHSMRNKYRSAIYTFTDKQKAVTEKALIDLQTEFDKPIITQVMPFKAFKLNEEKYLNYYEKNADKAFCQNFINPKLQHLREKYQEKMKPKGV